MTDTPYATFLHGLTSGTTPDYTYGIEGGASPVSKKYAGTGVFNVKDYGALGNYSGNDAPYIQLAINAALAVSQPSGNTYGAVVFFPPGEYLITESLHLPNPGYEASITLRGSGQTASTIIGNFVGYLINKPEDLGVTIKSIEDMAFLNHDPSNFSGGIRMDRASNVSLSRLQIAASNALHIGGSDSNFQSVSTISNASPGVVSSTTHLQRVGQAIAFDNDKTIFTCTAANATASAVYKDVNGRSYTVDSTITGATTLFTTGQVAPTSGTLTKFSGTGDATITFSSARSGLPLPLVDRYHAGTNNYFIVKDGITANAFSVSLTADGTPINTTTAHYGTTTFLVHNNVFCVKVDQCVLTGNGAVAGTAGTYGALVGQVEFFGCTFDAWDVALAHSNVGLIVLGSRFETNNKAILLGDNLGYTASATSHNAVIMGNSFERDDLQLHGLNCTGAFVASNAFTGNISVDGLGTTVTGVILVTCQTAQFCGNSVSGTFSSAGFDLSGIDALNCVFSGNQVNISSGTPWIMPANNQRINCSFIGNDNPSNAITFVGLPGQGGQHLAAVQGQTFYITDGNQATAGSSVTAGSGSNKSWVTYDGTNWIRGAA